MFNIGLPELLLILVIALLVVGPRRLPEVARSIGKTLFDVRKMAEDLKQTVEEELEREPEKEKKGEEEKEKSG